MYFMLHVSGCKFPSVLLEYTLMVLLIARDDSPSGDDFNLCLSLETRASDYKTHLVLSTLHDSILFDMPVCPLDVLEVIRHTKLRPT